MKKLIILIIPTIFIFSCANENGYKTLLENYFQEDLNYKNQRLKYQLNELETKVEEQPMKYTPIYKDLKIIDSICNFYETKFLLAKNSKEIHNSLLEFKENLGNVKFHSNSTFKSQILNLKISTTSALEKFNIIRKIKQIQFQTNELEIGFNVSTDRWSSFTEPYIMASRLNKDQVVINIYSDLLRTKPSNFDNKSIETKKIRHLNGENINILKENNSPIKSIIVESKKDTFSYKGIIKTKEKIGLIISEIDSTIIVGRKTKFNDSLIKKYLNIHFK